MKIAIVDDLKNWQQAVESLVKSYLGEKAKDIDVFSSGEAFNYEKKYDVVFLDIEMPGIDGFETARRYKENYENAIIIFLTTHTELSRKGYMVSAFRYIDKANMEEEIQEALQAIEALQRREHHVTFRVLYVGEISVPVKKILYIETEKRNVLIHTKEEDYISNRQIESLEEELKDLGFFRSHKSYLVNLENIHQFDRESLQR